MENEEMGSEKKSTCAIKMWHDVGKIGTAWKGSGKKSTCATDVASDVG
jgi:hypothetical protein